MKKVLTVLALSCIAHGSAMAEGWPAEYGGVMLQGFYWDSYSDSRWTNLTSQADELSAYFDLIWVPNSAKSAGSPTMGYMPIYWFTNHNSSFGSATELSTMIKAFKSRGTGIIADVVVNHRVGVNGWYDFPDEKWNGVTYHIGLEGICSNDEMANTSGQPKPTGARDTGENFDGARDLDHTNANVQNAVKNYCKFLIDELGYEGFRYDMVKGYSGQYTKLYNQYSKPRFSVGEYFDGSYDACAAWIESTGRESAVFDFPAKFAINSAFSSGDMSQLVWKANYVTPQPAGLIHYGYPQYAVTFIDNHDTARDHNKFNGNVVAANAFILLSPGTPCVFLSHWKEHKAEIKKLIAIRKGAGITNTSAVKVLTTNSGCYMAEITGSKGAVVVKIGNGMESPAGYSNSDIKTSGTGYCVWSKINMPLDLGNVGSGGDTPITVEMPSKMYLMGHLPQGAWATNVGVELKREDNSFVASNVTISESSDVPGYGFFSFVTALGSTGSTSEWDAVVNASDRYGASSKDLRIIPGQKVEVRQFIANVDASMAYSWAIAPGTYDVEVNFENKTLCMTKSEQSVDEIPEVDNDTPVHYYNLQGVEVSTPLAPGLYIRLCGTATTKVIVR
ncbi:MAG: alpha-amylase family glycosyl hydrolase [Odoribacter sp.]|nr:alpha-amylase family glycosyl hydrolase [Odoribacter sp.]